jgi:hypothetical protein
LQATTTRTHAVVVARMKDGTIAFVSRLRDQLLTRHRNHAWVMTTDDAYDCQQRYHMVQAMGHYHQDVMFYDVCRVNPPRKRAR